ncbi:MAG TPA: DUF427 domain-containing protein [Methanoregulaceae archaeon]|nr:DUF427 domain-containing protein [Methanoregulaceae archaeon]
MKRAVWKGAILAESDQTIFIEDNHYFPPESVDMKYLTPSPTTTTCFWKGIAHYYTLVVDGHKNPDAAWCYPDPKPAASEIKGYIAFWKGVRVE